MFFQFYYSNQVSIYLRRNTLELYGTSYIGEQTWHCGETAHLLSMWPRFDSGLVPYGLNLLLVLALLQGFSGFSGFSPSTKTNIYKCQFDQDGGHA